MIAYRRCTLWLFTAWLCLFWLPLPAQTADLSIGTASRAGVYYQVGRALCRLINDSYNEHGLRCETLVTGGSIANLHGLRNGTMNLAVVQSDWHYHAIQGSGPFQTTGPDTELRALFSVHGEPFTLVARRDADITQLDDLIGQRVNIGNPGSGQRATMEVVMAAKNWTLADFALANELPAAQQSMALCHDRVQAMVYTVGHPNDSVAQAVRLCDARLVEVSDSTIDILVADHPYYAYMEIPGGLYTGNPDPVRTFGVKATLVASAQLDEEAAYVVVQTLFENIERFKTLHPAFAALVVEEMLQDGLSAPLHAGAERYYREQGWLQD